MKINKPEISIIIPIYNAEKYLEQCISSIQKQTYENFELILVDDCSTDKSSEICLKYKELDTRIIYIKTKQNSGSAKIPINLGLDVTNGKYIAVIGNDDFLDTSTVEKLYSRALETNADVTFLKMCCFQDNNTQIIRTIPDDTFDFNQILQGKEAVMLTINHWHIGCNFGLYKSHIYKNLSTYKNITRSYMNADEYDTRELILSSEIVAFCNTNYYYRKHDNSITTRISSKLFETIYADEDLLNLFKKHFIHDSYQYNLVCKKYTTTFFHLLNTFVKIKKELSPIEYKKSKKILVETKHFIIKNLDLFNTLDGKQKLLLNFPLKFIIVSKSIFSLKKYIKKILKPIYNILKGIS